MTKPSYPSGWAAGSQVRGRAPSPGDCAWNVNFNNGNANWNNHDNNGFVRAVRAGECQGAVSLSARRQATRCAHQQQRCTRSTWLESLGNREPDNTAVAFAAGYSSSTGGGFVNPRGQLHTGGLIEYRDGRMRLTAAGRAHANVPEHIGSNAELHERVMRRLPGPERKLLQVLLDRYPASLTNDELAAAAGYGSSTGGGFVNPRGRLNTLGLIEYRAGVARASDNLFPLPR